jgi:phage gp46-like protein
MAQQGDVLLCQTNNDGDISVVDGTMTMTPSFETAVYLSLFGGNEDDDATDGTLAFNWWGNIDEVVVERRYRSRTQNLLQSLPPTSQNLLKLEDAVLQDLQWFEDLSVASELTAIASIPELNKLRIDITIKAEGIETTFSFTENWKAST